MKVIHINEHLALKGGVETYMLSLLPLLNKRGVNTHVLFGAGDPSLHDATMHIPGIGRPEFGLDASVENEVADYLRKEQPDVIHVHNIQNVGVLKACFSYGRTIMTSHDFRTVCPANTFFYRRTQEVCDRTAAGLGCFPATLQKRCMTLRPTFAAYYYNRSRLVIRETGRFSHVIAPSSVAGKRLIQAGFAPESVSVLPYFCPLPPRKEPRRPPRQTTITYMGRVAPSKGHEYFLEALGLLPESVHGLFVGDLSGEKGDHIRQLAERHDCLDRLTLKSWASREEIAGVFADTTIFIFPSLWEETLGIVGLEAMSQGVPVVASELGGVFDWLEDGKSGYRVRPKSAPDIRDAVLRILEEDPTTERFGRHGIETVRNTYAPALHVDGLLGHYNRIAHVD